MAGARKQKLNPDQLPLITPDSDWIPPTELPDLRGRGRTIAIDAETKDDGIAAGIGAGWAYKQGHICGVAAAWGGEGGEAMQSLYASIRHPETQNFDRDQVARWLDDHFRDPDTRIVCQNGGYDFGWFQNDLGVAPPPGERIDDTQAAAVMVDENRLSYKLDDLCKWRGVPGKDENLLREAASAYGTDAKGGMWRMPARYVGPYAAQDGVSTLMLFRSLRRVMEEEQTLGAYGIECALIPMIMEMRRRGVRLDISAAHRTAKELEARRDEVLANLSYRVGRRVEMGTIDSPRHMEAMFSDQGIEFPRTEKTNQGSFQNDWMKKHNHWLPQMCAQASRLHMAADKFVRGFLINFAHRGRLHAEIHQFRSDDGGTRSHRFSYANPPLQQMPSRDAEMLALIRGLFLPEEGELWGAHDYSQQEYRLIVHYASLAKCDKADDAVQKYIDDPKTDFHSLVAELTGLDRKPAKDTNFAKAFGAGVAKFALMTGKTLAEAKAIMEQYDREMPFVAQLGRLCQSKAEQRGYIRLIDGALSHFDQWEPARRGDGPYEAPRSLAAAREKWEHQRLRRAYVHKAMNRLIQGSAARQTKMAMLEMWRQGIVPLIQMHDEVSCSQSNEAQGRIIAGIMRDIIKLRLPVAVDSEYGISWGTATKVEMMVDGKKTAVYKASWDEAARLRDEGRYWEKAAA